MTRLVGRLLAVGLVAAACLVVLSAAAWGHATFTSSTPEPGTQLAAAPGVVTVRFTEPLIVDLSSLRVTDPDGRVWERTAVADRKMSASLDTTAQGVYVVEWKTVSPLDGHTLRGTFRFGVGVTPSEVEPATSVEPATADVVLAVGRAVEYAALLLLVGMVVVGRLGRREPALGWVGPRRRGLVAAVALTAGSVVVGGEALLAVPSVSWDAVAGYLSAQPGTPRLGRLTGEVVAVVAAWLGMGWLVAGGAAAALVGLAAAGHAAAAHPAWWGISVDAGHLLAAGVWAGGIVAMARLRPPGGWRGEDARQLVRRFSPVAVPAFVVTVATGTLRGTQELVGLHDLWATSYGQVLLLKVAAVGAMVPLSWRAWQRRSPRPRVEAVLAAGVVAAAALLAAYPVTPQRAAEDAAQTVGVDSPAYPQPGDLTLARATGDVMVGLTLRPGRPGRNDVLVYLLPPSGPEDVDGTDATLQLAGQQHRLERCGVACRRTVLTVDGGERIAVTVAGVDADPAVFELPALPAPDGTPLVEEMASAMDQLRSLRYEEVFGPVDPPIRSDAALVAPDRLRFEVHTFDRTTIRIGDVTYRREGDGPWEVTRGPQVSVPSYIWDYSGKTGVRIVGQQQVDGTSTQVVSFFVLLGDDLPIWYRLWIDADGLVQRAEMRAQGHFMDQRYFDFDAPITIEPPPDAPEPPADEETS
ncbi:MAG TPA: copper resistance protein CopC [Nitriliruptorales bacterium]|nr:copper resistance protein CopC [Nitriliruptorales bacterium]